MKIQDYCKAMLAEVTAWKEKLEALKKVADSYGTAQKEKILPLIGQLEQEVVTAQMRVQKLETECPSDWSPMNVHGATCLLAKLEVSSHQAEGFRRFKL
jgi:hypothetical protein